METDLKIDNIHLFDAQLRFTTTFYLFIYYCSKKKDETNNNKTFSLNAINAKREASVNGTANIQVTDTTTTKKKNKRQIKIK